MIGKDLASYPELTGHFDRQLWDDGSSTIFYWYSAKRTNSYWLSVWLSKVTIITTFIGFTGIYGIALKIGSDLKLCEGGFIMLNVCVYV